jgi:hypothetical protein
MLEGEIAAGICAQRDRFGLEPDECETPMLKKLVAAITKVGAEDFAKLPLDRTFKGSGLSAEDQELLDMQRSQEAFASRERVAARVAQLRELAHKERTLTDANQAIADGDTERLERIARRPSPPPSPNTPKPSNAAAWKGFPLDCLPRSLSGYVADCAALQGVDPAAIALPLLASLAGLIGSRYTVSPAEERDDWNEMLALWSCVILPSGSGKTPAQKHATSFLTRLQADLFKAAADENKSRSEADETVEPKRIVVSDVTVEGICKLLGANPNGLTCIVDELSSMMGALGRYGQGSGRVQADRGQWLSLYNGEPITLDRKNSETIYARQAVASIVANTQPGIARRLFDQGAQESGMLARFCVAWPPSKPTRITNRKPDAAGRADAEGLFRRIHALPSVADEPKRLWLSPEAFEVFRPFSDEQSELAHATDGNAAAAISKTPGLALRIAGVLHLALSLSSFGADGVVGSDGIPSMIDAETTAHAVKLARWLNAERLRVYGRLAADEAEAAAERLADSIPWSEYPQGITPSELHKRNKSRFGSAEAAETALRDAARRGLIAERYGVRTDQQVGGRETLIFLPLGACASETLAQADR